jgi:hypothetical protein
MQFKKIALNIKGLFKFPPLKGVRRMFLMFLHPRPPSRGEAKKIKKGPK